MYRVTDDLRGLVTAAGAVNVREPRMFTYDVTMTQVIIVEAEALDSSKQFESELQSMGLFTCCIVSDSRKNKNTVCQP